ncbi:hypothetical protein GCM10022226_68580 [Sphaerisporangium flaviroseum]|uniref:Uncharacterized protein n=1 Tax=Sphaerisporangium flaviroseum TaxID=509199 RepID=A0ABP7J7I1_9ACTN
MNSTRSTGYDGSTGKNAPPAFTTAKTATTNSTDRGNTTATTHPGPTPHPINTRANRLAHPFNSPYDNSTSPTTNAKPPPTRPA